MSFFLKIPHLLFFVLFLTLIPFYQNHASEDTTETIQHLENLLNRSGKDYQVKIRITSHTQNGEHLVVILQSTRDAEPTGDRLLFRLAGENIPAYNSCLQCSAGGETSACENNSGEFITEPGTHLPGSILPWEEILVGACADWRVGPIDNSILSEQYPQATYSVEPVTDNFDASWRSTLIVVDKITGNPDLFLRIDKNNHQLRKIKVVEIGRIGSWTGIRSAIITTQHGRILMEIIGFSMGTDSPKPWEE
ncbi:MAG: hypothetical protein ABW104_02670 [Candidatus Thiodiazotropha sp. 6PLUC2]